MCVYVSVCVLGLSIRVCECWWCIAVLQGPQASLGKGFDHNMVSCVSNGN